jgi:hypothetical protein
LLSKNLLIKIFVNFNLNLFKKINSTIDKKYKKRLLKKKKNKIIIIKSDRSLKLIAFNRETKKSNILLFILRLSNNEVKNNGIEEILNPSIKIEKKDNNKIKNINNKSLIENNL